MEIKENIQLLCRLLYSCGFTPMTPEIFRQAKFNQDNSIIPLWKLLYELVSYLHDGEVNTCDELESETVSVLKEKIYILGYKASTLLELSLESKSCSRELLLSVGWIISTYSVIDIIASSCISSSLINCEDSSCINKKKETKISMPLSETITELASSLLWHFGHLKFSLSSLLTVQQQRIAYLHEIHKRTEGKGLSNDSSHLSMLQSVIVTNKDLQTKYIEQLEKETKLLASYLHWKEGESIFWKWMRFYHMHKILESVIDLKQKESAKVAESINNKETFLPTNELSQRTMTKEICPALLGMPTYEPRLIFQSRISKTKTTDNINKELCSVKTQLKEKVKTEQEQHKHMFEEMAKKLHGVLYISP